jgi:uncharacterized protein involved in type VI secretion and phage assembly
MTPTANACGRAAPSLAITALGEGAIDIAELSGDEALGCPVRFDLAFSLPVGLDPATALGAAAALSFGRTPARLVRGVIAEIETAEAEHGQVPCRARLVPRAWLLSQGRHSRTFERLSVPEIVEAVVSSSGLALVVERRLAERYPARERTVQHRENDLDFVSRLLEREGIVLSIEDEKLLLTDRNESLPGGDDLGCVPGLRRRHKLLPRTVALFDQDPERPDLPLCASALVSEQGVGELEVHDEHFATPEEGERMARLCAERLRASALVLHGEVDRPVSAGQRVRASGRELVLLSVRHTLGADQILTSRFTALPVEVPARPERRAPEPRIFGVMAGRVAPWEPGQTSTDRGGVCRVRDLGGGTGERSIPVGALGSDGGLSFGLAEGTEVLWSCLDGNPDRPILAAALCDPARDPAPRGRAAVKAPGGAVVEIGGSPAAEPGAVDGCFDPRVPAVPVPAVAHHAETVEEPADETNTTDTWIRFGVPHSGTGARKWTYLRIGESATGTALVSAKQGSFSETTAFVPKPDITTQDAENLPGVFDYTDFNRTIFAGGRREEIVKGEARTVVYANKDATDDTDPKYEMVVTADKTAIDYETPRFAFTKGTDLSAFSGFKFEAMGGLDTSVAIGGKLEGSVGFSLEAFAGYKMEFTLGDSLELSKGSDLGIAESVDKRAKTRIQYSILPGIDAAQKGSLALACATAVGSLVLAGIDVAVAESCPKEDWKSGVTVGVTSAVAAALLIAITAATAGKDPADGDPILSLDKDAADKKRAILRADDWMLYLTPDWAFLGRNKKYANVKSVSQLDEKGTTTAIFIKEPKKITLQTDNLDTKPATIQLDDKKITIKGDTIEIKSTADADATITITGPVTFKGDVTMEKTLTVAGNGTFKAKLTAGG